VWNSSISTLTYFAEVTPTPSDATAWRGVRETHGKVKVKSTLDDTMKAEKGSGGVVLLFL
jgi:hypothetical protein